MIGEALDLFRKTGADAVIGSRAIHPKGYEGYTAIRKAAEGWDTDGEWERAMGVTPIGQLEDDENSLGAGRRLRGGNPRVGNGVSPPGSFKIGQQCRTLGGVT